MHTSSIRSALATVFQISLRPISHLSQATRSNIPRLFASSNGSQTAPFSSSSSRLAKKDRKIKPDRRITMIRYHLYHPTTLMPRPLRFSRNRALRHWTIHRAWNLFRHKLRVARQTELERQYNAMAAACEELRVGAGDGGKLFRTAMMKTGVWSIPERGGGVPIEYARGMVEWVGSSGGVGGTVAGGKARIWDSEWKRG